jgi:hypothetical protein
MNQTTTNRPTGQQTVAIYGATGYTGRRVAAQLLARKKRMKKLLPLLVLVPFVAFSLVIMVQNGIFFLADVCHGWPLQVTLDLYIALFMVGAWMRRDAKQHAINPWPYIAGLPFIGSIAALVYLVRRNLLADLVGVRAPAEISDPRAHLDRLSADGVTRRVDPSGTSRELRN